MTGAAQAAGVAQLEPTILVEAFLAHPPHGFEARPAGGSAGFLAPYDLRTTLSASLARRIGSIGLCDVARRLLTWRVHFVGSTSTEYLVVPAGLDVDRFIDGVLAATPSNARMVVFKDIARASPLLTAQENAVCETLLEALRSRGFVLLQGMALAWADVGESEHAYLAKLSHGRRRDIRRKLRRRASIDVLERPTGAPCYFDEAYVDLLYALYENVHAQSEIHFDRLTRGFFVALLRHEASGVVFEYRRGDALLGWNLCYPYRGALVDKYVGFAYPAARENNLYCVSWMHALDYARRNGLSRYIAGWTDMQAKRDLGAKFTWTWNAARPRSRLLRAVARAATSLFEDAPQ